MRNHLFKEMEANRARYFKLIKEGENPNPLLIKEVGEEYSDNSETSDTIPKPPLLNINRVIDCEQRTAVIEETVEETIMQELAERREINLLNWFREIFLKKMHEWFEIPMAVESGLQGC